MAVRREEEEKNPWEEVRTYRQYMEPEYLDVSYRSIILFDIVPYEKRDKMIEGLKQLFGDNHKGFFSIEQMIQNIPDIKKRGLFSQSSRLGTIHNNKRFEMNGAVIGRHGSFYIWDGAISDLPEEFDDVEVHIEQLVDFSYCLLYECRIAESHSNRNIKETYVRSGDMIPKYAVDGKTVIGSISRGPDHEPTIDSYEKTITEFISTFSHGLFLNDNSKGKNCPTIRVLSTPSINFDNFTEWEQTHRPFIYFLGMRSPLFSRYGEAVVTYQDERIFGEYPFPHGICILYSEKDVDVTQHSSLRGAITYKATFVASSMTDFLLSFYWIANTIRDLDDTWSKRLRGISQSLPNPSDPLKTIEEKGNQLITFYKEFAPHANSEKIRMRKIEERINSYSKRFMPKPIPLGIQREFNIYADLLAGIERWSRTEVTMLDDLQKQVDTFLAYQRDLGNTKLSFSNLSLQEKIKLLAIITLIVGIAIPSALALLQRLG